ncbi:hypothetical protein CBOM_06980 [Ceraceosorus bombacis]|uniref:Uncharacterized protein n=1 Tax=Ceraceosorus bombacis TaxID=401625 RepID=A0A0P1BKK6_9BASI|nr:hypothetical protein CBOM_06980 [Ceraceosorus bombacis]
MKAIPDRRVTEPEDTAFLWNSTLDKARRCLFTEIHNHSKKPVGGARRIFSSLRFNALRQPTTLASSTLSIPLKLRTCLSLPYLSTRAATCRFDTSYAYVCVMRYSSLLLAALMALITLATQKVIAVEATQPETSAGSGSDDSRSRLSYPGTAHRYIVPNATDDNPFWLLQAKIKFGKACTRKVEEIGGNILFENYVIKKRWSKKTVRVSCQYVLDLPPISLAIRLMVIWYRQLGAFFFLPLARTGRIPIGPYDVTDENTLALLSNVAHVKVAKSVGWAEAEAVIDSN